MTRSSLGAHDSSSAEAPLGVAPLTEGETLSLQAWAAGRATINVARKPYWLRMAPIILRATGWRSSPSARLRVAWTGAYQEILLGALEQQADRIDRAWLQRHVVATQPIPPGGAIDVVPHFTGHILGVLQVGTETGPHGLIADWVPGRELGVYPVGPGELQASPASRAFDRVFGPRIWSSTAGLVEGVRLLKSGGCLSIAPDFMRSGGRKGCFFGRRMRMGEGPVWLAERTGKPLYVRMLVPDGWRWQLWTTGPVPPTHAGLRQAMEKAVCQAPTGWMGWHTWWAAPPCPGGAECSHFPLSNSG